MQYLELVGRDAGRPTCATKWAMVIAGIVLIAGKIAILTKRNDVKPVAICIEMIFGKVAIPSDVVGWTKLGSLLPSGGFDANKLDVASVRILMNKKMSELVQKFERGGGDCIKNLVWGSKFCLVAELDG